MKNVRKNSFQKKIKHILLAIDERLVNPIETTSNKWNETDRNCNLDLFCGRYTTLLYLLFPNVYSLTGLQVFEIRITSCGSSCEFLLISLRDFKTVAKCLGCHDVGGPKVEIGQKGKKSHPLIYIYEKTDVFTITNKQKINLRHKHG